MDAPSVACWHVFRNHLVGFDGRIVLMTISLRFYIFTPDGLQRISQRIMEGLCHGRDAMPQFAGTKQKVASAILELENGKPARIARVEGSYLDFDLVGKVHESLQRGAIEAMETFAALERSERIKPSKVIDIAAKLNREKWQRDNRWTPSRDDVNLIAADIFSRKLAPEVKHAKSAAEKVPSLTYEARQTVYEILTHVVGIDSKLECLSEPALKGFAFEARKRAKDDLDNPVWLGVANAADRRREILARYRTGKGIWYASVDVIRWNALTRSGESEAFAHERCNSKKEAEEAARRLLAEHAKYFSAEVSIEARVVCDLEWQDDLADDDS